ncbi:MAG TPA: GNAT family N-acetyltransferase [Candidatus Limnocylindrales bacterium]|nr:GNAT family N-acetyltransferase [Candidatus Limnocylindrales bacterium]
MSIRPSAEEKPASDSGSVRIRDARRDDVPLIAQVLEMAGRGHLERGPWNLIYPDPVELMRALEHFAGGATRTWCHHSLFHVAEQGGVASAALVTFEPAELGDTSLAIPLYESFSLLGWTPERIAGVGPLVAPYLECFPDMPAGTWIVENVGTLESARRQGLVRLLLERAVELGRERGWKQAQISCLIGNDPAQRAYERAGFEVVEERRSAAFEKLIGAPGFSRMTRRL